MTFLPNIGVRVTFLLFLIISWCLPTIHTFTPSQSKWRSESRARHRESLQQSLSRLTSSLNKSLAVTKETSAPYQQDGVEESKPVRKKSGIKVSSRAVGKTPTNIYTATSLQGYNDLVEKFKGNIIVTRFHAKWCKSCLATQPLFHRLAKKNPGMIFIEVPVQTENSDLHQSLNVSSVPFSRIYYPSGDLVEEMKLSKKRWPAYEKIIGTYAQGFCVVEDGNYSNHVMCDNDLPY